MIYANTIEEHEKRLQQVLRRIENAGVTLNDKCEFNKESITFLGHIIDANGFRPDPQKTKAIKQMKEPKSIEELRRVLGMFNHLQKFVPSAADLTRPLRDLLRKQTPWCWGESQKQAFEGMKTRLIKPPILAMFDPTKETILSTDASSYGLGSVIIKDTDLLRPQVLHCGPQVLPFFANFRKF